MKMVYVKVLWLLGKWDEKLEIFVLLIVHFLMKLETKCVFEVDF